MPNEEETLRTLANDTINGLVAWRDEVKLKIHLATMEGKDEWGAVETNVGLAEARLHTVVTETIPAGGHQIGTDLRVALHDVRMLLAKIKPNLDAIGGDLSKAGREVMAKLEVGTADITQD